MKTKLLSLLEKTLNTLPAAGAAIGVTLLACIFSGVLRDILLRNLPPPDHPLRRTSTPDSN